MKKIIIPVASCVFFAIPTKAEETELTAGVKKIGTEVMSAVNSLSAGNLKPNFIEYVDDDTVALTFDGKRFDNPCGIEVNWGDGTVEKVRIEKDFYKDGFTLQHNYPKANQTYELVINGKFIFRGLKTLASCPGDYTDTLKLSVK